jgi:CheY-like chemotaxis protein
MVLALAPDLFFGARIRETARQLDVACEIVKTPAALVEKAPGAAVIIVDMSMKGEDPGAAVRVLKADPQTRAIPVVGYLFDSDEAAIKAARAAGCDKVLSRGGLTQKLADIVGRARGS